MWGMEGRKDDFKVVGLSSQKKLPFTSPGKAGANGRGWSDGEYQEFVSG